MKSSGWPGGWGCLDRFIRLRPDNPQFRINLCDYLLKVPGNSPTNVAAFLGRINDIAARSDGGNQGEKYWVQMFEQALTCSIDLCQLAYPTVTLEMVKNCLITSPATPEQANPETYLRCAKPSFCAAFLNSAQESVTPLTQRRLARAQEFFLVEFASLGYRARGAIMAMVNSILGRLLVEPFHGAFSASTTLTPELIAKHRLLVALDCDVLTWDIIGRFYQLIWIQLMQGYCLRRDASNAPYVCIFRDEYALFSQPSYDAQVAALARSQRCIHIDAFQDFDLLEATYGGGPRAKNEAISAWASHGVKFMGHQANPDSAEINSRLIGDKAVVLPSGGACHQPQGNWYDRALGVNQSVSWSTQYRRAVPPEAFSTLGVGEGYLHFNGEVQYLNLKK